MIEEETTVAVGKMDLFSAHRSQETNQNQSISSINKSKEFKIISSSANGL
jgi:hypothetical protein